MNNDISINDVLFDRLVDGELPEVERRALLESLETQPQGWRCCALAFLEAQSWQAELRTVVPKTPAKTELQKTGAPSAPAKRISILAAAQWLAVAASLLVAFKLGNLQHGSAIRVAGGPTRFQDQVASAPGAPAPTSKAPGDALNLWVRDDAGQMRRVRVPLVDASTLDHDLGLQFQTGVPDDVRDQLQDHGYAVQSKHQYAPMWLDNGRPMIVPVEDTKIVPVSNKVY
ncbi:MAG TPA: hypothetical protein VHU84_09570 [Lacipirellulaceae bacterium]|jgi:hypothetical protein|nr:hypothetical protein [Lacipirellulaceae bacterium]